MTRARLLCLVLALGALAARPAAGQDEIAPSEVVVPFQSRQAAAPGALLETWRRFAVAWAEGDARAVARLAGDSRVHVVVERASVGARLAPAQLLYLLDELFQGADEVGLRFPTSTAYDPDAETAYAIGERRYRDGAHVAHVDRVFVGARSEHGRWVITELRLTAAPDSD